VIANGHGEYWTREMRQAWDAARDTGGNLVFAGADFGFWQVRYEDGGATMVGYKSPRDPISDPPLKTIAFRNLIPPQPECRLVGVQYQAVAESAGTKLLDGGDYVVVADPARTPWMQGTGLEQGEHLSGLVGYEWDSPVAGCAPPGTQQLFAAPGAQPAAAVTYATPSGGHVLSFGSMFFTFGLDDYGSRTPMLPPVQTFVRNALDDMAGPRARSKRPVTVLAARRKGARRIVVRLRANTGTVRGVRIAVRQRPRGKRIGHARLARLTTEPRSLVVRVRRRPGARAVVIVTAQGTRTARRLDR
jgi:hypothetical protein